MDTLTIAQVVLIPFPFSDLSGAKLRPAVVLVEAGRGDWILCQITSNPYADPKAIPLKEDDFEMDSLKVPSFVRPGKLFTANAWLISGRIGFLKPEPFQSIIQSVLLIFRTRAS